ncbi:MAG: NYN domain-containing protein [Verrucomicrobiota bacterium]
MVLVRILVDGYSLLHNWPELAPGRARHSAAARDELVHVLTQYRDATSTPVTVFFDGAGSGGSGDSASTPEVEIIFSKSGQTADDLIERAAHRFQPYGEVMVVTDDHAERDLVAGLGGLAVSCFNFIRMVEHALAEQDEAVHRHNHRERNAFKRR